MSGDLELALDLADRADAITTEAFGRADLVVDTKPDRSWVTEADRRVEATVRAVLAERRPDDAVVGEEEGTTGTGRRRWVVDPIDGTANFVRRVPVWATLLALEEDGQPVVGVVSAPALGRRWWAARGQGAFAAPTGGPAARIRVSDVARLEDAHVSGCGVEGWEKRGRTAGWDALVRRCWRERSFGDFWSHMLVAEGACDVGVDPVVNIWDVAALLPIVQEAGGRLTDLDGSARADGGSAISTNGLLHEEVLTVLHAKEATR